MTRLDQDNKTYMQVLLFFGQGVKNAKQIDPILQQALVMLQLWFYPSSMITFFFLDYFLIGGGVQVNRVPSSPVGREVREYESAFT